MHNPTLLRENDTHKLHCDFKKQKEDLISTRQRELIIINNNKKKNPSKIVDFADHKVKLKESEKKDKNLDLPMKLKKLWNMKVTFIPIVIGTLRTVTKRINKGIGGRGNRGQGETIQTTTLLRSARILRRVLET